MTAEARARHVVAYAIKKDQEQYILVGSPLLILSFMRALVSYADVAFAFKKEPSIDGSLRMVSNLMS
ncbi:hypothetical protein [Pseudomonas syringae]|uniref:hypothetical protein n=1 Tax=Pseudomonas syringae TaxID=317 RepID=UPI00126659F4|nr:hypothetical protein [Pseudomonas syringae]